MRATAAILIALAATSAIAAGGDVPSAKTLYDQKCAICHGKDGVAKPSARTCAISSALSTRE